MRNPRWKPSLAQDDLPSAFKQDAGLVDWSDVDGRPPYWRDKATRMIGKRVLVGKTYMRGEEVLEQVQFHGLIETADERMGFTLRRADTGDLESLPPDLRAFRPAEPGEYTLRSSGEVVSDPDFIATWIAERGDPTSRAGSSSDG